MPASGQITQLLRRFRAGDVQAESELLTLTYEELRRMAARFLRREREGHTLQPTALVNEAYLQLVDQREKEWHSRAHFLAVAAQVMRRILVDHARRRQTSKRSGTYSHVEFTEAMAASHVQPIHILDLNSALDRLAEIDRRQMQIVEFRFFSGMTEEEIAEVLGISSRTVKRDWQVARAWLFGQLRNTPAGDRVPVSTVR